MTNRKFECLIPKIGDALKDTLGPNTSVESIDGKTLGEHSSLVISASGNNGTNAHVAIFPAPIESVGVDVGVASLDNDAHGGFSHTSINHTYAWPEQNIEEKKKETYKGPSGKNMDEAKEKATKLYNAASAAAKSCGLPTHKM